MKRREFLGVLGGAATAWPLAAHAQQTGKVWRVGMLETTTAMLNGPNLIAFRAALRELGYIEGQSLVIDYRSADGRAERFPALAAELVGLKVDVLVTRGTPAAVAAKNADGTTPVVMTAIAEPFLVVQSLARPGGNVTGLSSLFVDLTSKRLELIREVVPGASRIAWMFNGGNPTIARSRIELQQAAQTLRLDVQIIEPRKPEDLAPAFETAVRQRADAIQIGIDTLTQANRALIVDLAAKHRLPALYSGREFVEAGGLISYGVNYPDLYRRAASYVDKVFKGAKPADLPVEQPTKFESVINLKTAKALGLTISESFLLRADEVIE